MEITITKEILEVTKRQQANPFGCPFGYTISLLYPEQCVMVATPLIFISKEGQVTRYITDKELGPRRTYNRDTILEVYKLDQDGADWINAYDRNIQMPIKNGPYIATKCKEITGDLLIKAIQKVKHLHKHSEYMKGQAFPIQLLIKELGI